MKVGYTITVIRRACELREYGWSLRRIADFVEQDTGRRPSCSTVLAWVDADAAKKKAALSRKRHAEIGSSRGSTGIGERAPAWKLARMRALSELPGMSEQAIASVMSFDFGDDISRFQVRRALETGRYPKRLIPREEDQDIQQWVKEGLIAS